MENAALMVLHLLTAYILELLLDIPFPSNNEHVPFSETNPSHHITGGTSDQAQEASAGHHQTATAPPVGSRRQELPLDDGRRRPIERWRQRRPARGARCAQAPPAPELRSSGG